MTFDSNRFNDFIIARKIMSVSDLPFRLKSGKESHLYINWRETSNDVFSLDQVADFVLAFTQAQGLDPDCFFGVPEGATKLGVLSTYKLALKSKNYGYDSHCLPMGRGNIKEHGKPEDRFYIGLPVTQKTIVIEDVTTTGGSLIDCIDCLRDTGVRVIGALTLTNRQEDHTALPKLFENRYKGECPFYALSILEALMNRFIETAEVPEFARSLLVREFPHISNVA